MTCCVVCCCVPFQKQTSEWLFIPINRNKSIRRRKFLLVWLPQAREAEKAHTNSFLRHAFDSNFTFWIESKHKTFFSLLVLRVCLNGNFNLFLCCYCCCCEEASEWTLISTFAAPFLCFKSFLCRCHEKLMKILRTTDKWGNMRCERARIKCCEAFLHRKLSRELKVSNVSV